MFGYVPRKKVRQLIALYEDLLYLDRHRYPFAWAKINAMVGDLKLELGIDNREDTAQ